MLAIGHVLQNRYSVIAPLGHGGMGAVYRVRDMRLNIDRVLKEMLITPEMGEDNSRLVRQFQREAEALAALHHSNLPGVQDYFHEEDHYYLVMDYIEGYSLDTLIRPGGLPEATVLNYADQLLGVLGYIHGRGMFHRDIKPSNIIVQPDGRVVLVDFGLVKTVGGGGPSTKTLLAGIGTPEYAPPEQTVGGTDQRSDLFSLAATLYHALTGQFPFQTGMRSAGMRLPGIRELNPAVSQNTERVVLQAFNLDRNYRFNSAAEMRAALFPTGAGFTQPVAPRQPSAPLRTRVVPITPLPIPSMPPAAPPASADNRVTVIAVAGIVLAALVVIAALAVIVPGLMAHPTPTPEATSVAGFILPTDTAEPTATSDTNSITVTPVEPTDTAQPTVPALTTPHPVANNSNDLLLTLAPGVNLQLVRVPKGDFLMGAADADTTADQNQKPQQKLSLDEFLVGKYDVTNAEFAAFVAATGYRSTAELEGTGVILVSNIWTDTVGVDWQHPYGTKSSLQGKDNNPVVQISWDDALAFCQWASQVTGRDVHLPTEAQWEKAARGPSTAGSAGGSAGSPESSPGTSGDGRPYPWGMQAPSASFLNFNNNVDDTTPVGKYSPSGDSPYGAADMAGNVWEWTSSLIKDYPYDANDGREDLSSRKSRVLRGGSFYNDAKNVRSMFRLSLPPDYRYVASGFRVAVTPLAGTEIFAGQQTPTPVAGSDQQVFIAQSVHMDFVSVPAGQFLMGSIDSDKDAAAYEKPQSRLYLDSYLIGQYLVTNAQFAAFVDATGYKTTAEQTGSGVAYDGKNWVDTKGANWQHPRGPNTDTAGSAVGISGKDDYPVVQISYDDAVAFCKWASQVTGRHIQLPTEAQWEKAARGSNGRLYPWGDQPPTTSLANFSMNVGNTSPVGQYSPQGDSPFGAADMAGNAWEWTSTIYKAYPYNASDGREDPTSREARTLRGGAYYFDAKALRVANRAADKPELHNDLDSFRVVIVPD